MNYAAILDTTVIHLYPKNIVLIHLPKCQSYSPGSLQDFRVFIAIHVKALYVHRLIIQFPRAAHSKASRPLYRYPQ